MQCTKQTFDDQLPLPLDDNTSTNVENFVSISKS